MKNAMMEISLPMMDAINANINVMLDVHPAYMVNVNLVTLLMAGF